jgi:prolyl oligopeptidase PreP (S9A serine peptidase family)
MSIISGGTGTIRGACGGARRSKGASWLDRGTVLISSALGGEAFQTTSGYARTVRRWRRDTPFDQAQVVFTFAPAGYARECPQFLRKPTHWHAIGASGLGHFPTHAVQQSRSYSITWSAMASSPDGTSMSSARAV